MHNNTSLCKTYLQVEGNIELLRYTGMMRLCIVAFFKMFSKKMFSNVL